MGRETVAKFKPSTRIVGGEPAKKRTHPFQVALLFKFEPNDYFAFYCGGSLIAKDVVVTAAHCSDFVTAGHVQVLTGTQNLNGTGTRRDVKKIKIHPNWDPVTFDSDIAIWFLTSKASRIPTAKLALDDPSVGTVVLGAMSWANRTNLQLFQFTSKK
jgi:secreted trypsin-like serine protease